MNPRATKPGGSKSRPNRRGYGPPLVLDLFGIGFLAFALERMAKDVAECGAGIRRAVLGNRLFLLGHFKRLDRELHLGGAAVEQDDPGIDLLADLEAIGTLVVAVAGELRTLDEGGQIAADDLHVDAGLLDLGDLGG